MILYKFGDEKEQRTYKYWCKVKNNKDYARIRLRNRTEQQDKYFRFFKSPKMKGDVYQTVEYIRKHRSKRRFRGDVRDCSFAHRYNEFLYYREYDTLGEYMVNYKRFEGAGGWL